MMQVIGPRQWIKGELDRMIEVVERPNLSNEERIWLLKAYLNKFRSDLENPLMYKQELK